MDIHVKNENENHLSQKHNVHKHGMKIKTQKFHLSENKMHINIPQVEDFQELKLFQKLPKVANAAIFYQRNL
jgi:hypothetical protein